MIHRLSSYALIESDNYGSFDKTRPSRVYRDLAEGPAAEQRERRQAFETDKILVRDPVRGEPFLRVSEDEVTALAATFQTSRIGTAETIKLERAMGARFPDAPSDDQWLAPGTIIAPIMLGGVNGSGVNYMASKHGGKALALIRVQNGAHSGEMGLIDLRNYASNIRIICPPAPESLACGPASVANGQQKADAN